jgi:nucleoside-diphosphate-sugar epimerase
VELGGLRRPSRRVYGHGIEDMQHRAPSIEKIAAAIGWRPELDLERILADVIASASASPRAPSLDAVDSMSAKSSSV